MCMLWFSFVEKGDLKIKSVCTLKSNCPKAYKSVQEEGVKYYCFKAYILSGWPLKYLTQVVGVINKTFLSFLGFSYQNLL